MMIRKVFIGLFVFILITISACNGRNSAQEGIDYENTKKVVVDILQTEEGKEAFQKLAQDEDIKKHLVIESDVVQQTIHDVLTSEDGAKMWVTLFSDPTFVESYAKSIAEEHKKLMKQLMNDADFQQQMLDLLQNQEVNEQMLQVLKSQKFRKHLEDLIQQTFDTPLFQAKIAELLLQAAEQKSAEEDSAEQNKQDEKENTDQQNEQDSAEQEDNSKGS